MPKLKTQSANAEETLACFARDLQERGNGTAPNGARYRLMTVGRDRATAVERVYQGQRTVVVGFSDRTFLTPLLARAWALVDGRHEYAEGVSLCQREMLV